MATPDLSEFVALSKPRKPRCQVGAARDALTPGEQAALDAAGREDPNIISAGAIQKWLGARDQQVNTSAITHHRKGACSCGR